MSLEVRQRLAAHVIFQNPDVQRYQLTEIDPSTGEFVLSTWLIEAMDEMQGLGIFFEVTSLRDDHRDDSCLGPDNHNPAGRAMDFWFLSDNRPGAYLMASDPRFGRWLKLLPTLSHVSGIGLGGSADEPDLLHLLGSLGFSDNRSDHIHIQVSEGND
jgi:hypothetical protein